MWSMAREGHGFSRADIASSDEGFSPRGRLAGSLPALFPLRLSLKIERHAQGQYECREAKQHQAGNVVRLEG